MRKLMTTMLCALAIGGLAVACDSPEENRLEQQEQTYELERDRARDTLEEAAEGAASTRAAAEGRNQLTQEIEGQRAAEQVDEAFDRQDDAREQTMDRAEDQREHSMDLTQDQVDEIRERQEEATGRRTTPTSPAY